MGEGDFKQRDERSLSPNNNRQYRGPKKQMRPRDSASELNGAKVFVKNLNFQTSWAALKDFMRQAGEVLRADIFKNETGDSRGIG